ncbi:hypothetical protein AC249_AIPGENE7957 [Exaiptasia diaphana]|nr:hypothetical protein AC249_AIPGENE7957 [Exaiptasia diaphana]
MMFDVISGFRAIFKKIPTSTGSVGNCTTVYIPKRHAKPETERTQLRENSFARFSEVLTSASYAARFIFRSDAKPKSFYTRPIRGSFAKGRKSVSNKVDEGLSVQT